MAKKGAEFVFDFNRVTYREILEMELDSKPPEDEKALAEFKRTQVDESLDLIVRTCTEWPFDAEISVDSILDLGLEDFGLLQKSFKSAMDGVFR